jgi:hypothetical protein
MATGATAQHGSSRAPSQPPAQHGDGIGPAADSGEIGETGKAVESTGPPSVEATAVVVSDSDRAADEVLDEELGVEGADEGQPDEDGGVFVARRPRLVTSLLFNVLALGALWIAYSSIRSVTAESVRTARDNAHRLVDFQEWIGLPSEAAVQRLLLPYEWLVRGANVYYIGFHFPAMIAFLVWAMVWKREWMPRIRFALIGSTMVGLLIHLAFPLAPPRMLRVSGFIDTARLFGPDPYSLGISKAANEFAAMPSMHVGWALLIALAVVAALDTRWRWLIIVHPIATTAVVVITANHYWADVVVGALLGFIGWWVAGRLRPLALLRARKTTVDEPPRELTIDHRDSLAV